MRNTGYTENTSSIKKQVRILSFYRKHINAAKPLLNGHSSGALCSTVALKERQLIRSITNTKACKSILKDFCHSMMDTTMLKGK